MIDPDRFSIHVIRIIQHIMKNDDSFLIKDKHKLTRNGKVMARFKKSLPRSGMFEFKGFDVEKMNKQLYAKRIAYILEHAKDSPAKHVLSNTDEKLVNQYYRNTCYHGSIEDRPRNKTGNVYGFSY